MKPHPWVTHSESLRYNIPLVLFLYSLFFTPVRGQPPHSSLDEYKAVLHSRGLVNIHDIDSTIKVELKYASADNFTGSDLYGEFTDCYLQEKAARKLAQANKFLKEIRPDLTLLVADGLRPRHVQQKMWDEVKNTPRQRYVANPRSGSMHNYGCAVDVTICDSTGTRLDMGTPIDHFGPLAQPRLEKKYLKSGKLTRKQVENRKLLRKIMLEAGFLPLSIEWWHFNAFEKSVIRKKFTIVE
ncbi:MAG: M15 family metallopeptidase [Chitinispirillaceae bacterium]